uniref:Spen paralogue and orthologue SPOC C-terminal domain-containing protein n=1 Tax=Leersia perrieri TaxID=77586 RepID=A0A0D9WAA0_9ORYZ
MTSQSDSQDMIFQVYPPRKRKILDSVQYSESNMVVSHGSGLVTTANDSHRGEESFIKSPAGLSSILNNSQGFAPQNIPPGTTELSGITCTASPSKHNQTTTPSKPVHPHITFQLIHTEVESSHSCAKHADSTDQSQTAVAQKLLLSCKKGDQSILATVHPSLSLSYPDKIQQKEGIPSYQVVKHDVQDSTKEDDISSTLSPHSSDDEIESVVGLLSPSVYESLWDGTIQLSSTVKASVIAFFKSGEKNHDITWPKIIEIKGKVKLDAFEKFVQDLRRCQTRSLMVISLYWKFGTSKAGLQGMKEVAQNFEVNQKVGFADICDGSSLYVCPRSDNVITILAKCGFFKGMSAVDTNQDSLIGCIVCRRNPLSKIMDHNMSETIGKGSPCVPQVGTMSPTSLPFSDGQQAIPCFNNPRMYSSGLTSKIHNDIDQTQEIQSTSVKTHAVATGLPSQCGHGERTSERVHPTEKVPPFKSASLEVQEIQQHVQPITDSHSGSFGAGHGHSTSHYQPKKTGAQGLSLKSLDAQQRTICYDLVAQKNHMVEAFSGSITQQEYASNAAESSKLQENNSFLLQPNSYGAHRTNDTDFLKGETNDTDDLPEFDFANVHKVEVKYDVHPLNRETAITSSVLIRPKLPEKKSSKPFQQSSQPPFQLEGVKNHEKVEVKGNVTDMMSREITDKNKDAIDAEDTPERHFQGLDDEKLRQSGSNKQLSPSLKTPTGASMPSQAFPPITQRSNSPLEVEDISSGHHPYMPPGCLNIPRDQGSFPRHHPPDQQLAARHSPEDQEFAPHHPPPALVGQGFASWHPPPVPADQGFVPRHPPPALADQGFVKTYILGVLRFMQIEAHFLIIRFHMLDILILHSLQQFCHPPPPLAPGVQGKNTITIGMHIPEDQMVHPVLAVSTYQAIAPALEMDQPQEE